MQTSRVLDLFVLWCGKDITLLQLRFASAVIRKIYLWFWSLALSSNDSRVISLLKELEIDWKKSLIKAGPIIPLFRVVLSGRNFYQVSSNPSLIAALSSIIAIRKNLILISKDLVNFLPDQVECVSAPNVPITEPLREEITNLIKRISSRKITRKRSIAM